MDKKDLHVFLAAVMADCDCIVTSNEKDFAPVPIVRRPRRIQPNQFFTVVQSGRVPP